jgi:hypothetical protein
MAYLTLAQHVLVSSHSYNTDKTIFGRVGNLQTDMNRITDVNIIII